MAVRLFSALRRGNDFIDQHTLIEVLFGRRPPIPCKDRFGLVASARADWDAAVYSLEGRLHGICKNPCTLLA